MTKHFDVIVVSDLHLGARNSRPEDFLRFMDAVDTDHLIVAGDLFNHPCLNGLERRHVRVLRVLRDLAQFTRIGWLTGNHDPDPDWLAGLVGIKPQTDTVLAVGKRRYFVCHGHGWDIAMRWPRCVLSTAETVYSACQWLDPTHELARLLKRRSKRFCRCVEHLERHALSEARKWGFDGVILGHSHVSRDVVSDGVHYLNCGCWTECPCSFVGVSDGEPRVCLWDSGIMRDLSHTACHPLVMPAAA